MTADAWGAGEWTGAAAAVVTLLTCVGGGIGWLVNRLLAELKRKDDQIETLAVKFDATIAGTATKFDATLKDVTASVNGLGDRLDTIVRDNRAEQRETTQTMLQINKELVSTVGSSNAVLSNVVGKTEKLENQVGQLSSQVGRIEDKLGALLPPEGPRPRREGGK